MSNMLFDGKAFARTVEDQVRDRVSTLSEIPRLVSVLVGDDPASRLYSKLKKKVADRVGIEFQIEKIDKDTSVVDLKDRIKELIQDASGGLMVQLPLPDLVRDQRSQILESIPLDLDVDGLRWRQSGVMPATVRAVISVLDQISRRRDVWNKRFVVLGADGSVGAPLVHFLKKREAEVDEIEIDTSDPRSIMMESEVIISCVGIPGLVKKSDIRNGAIVVDVGIGMVDGKPRGDMENQVYEMASVAVPVPGGVGPVTVSSLMANSLDIFSLKK